MHKLYNLIAIFLGQDFSLQVFFCHFICVFQVYFRLVTKQENVMLGITHLFPRNELVHLPYVAVATNTRAD